MNRSRRVAPTALVLLLLLLVGCTRGGESPPADFPESDLLPTVATVPESDFDLPVQQPPTDTLVPTALPAEPPPVPAELPTSAPIPAGDARFSNLRFATTGAGTPQGTFPRGTDQVCAIWDYRDMQPSDTVRRTWKLNGELYVERQEAWDAGKYGGQGSVTDVCLFDRIDGYIDGAVDGIDPGTWTVELAVNGQPATSGQFVVGP